MADEMKNKNENKPEIKDEAENKKQGYRLIDRIVAVLGLALILFFLVGMLVCAFTGSRYFMGFFFGAVVVPVLLYVFRWIMGILRKS